MNNSKRNVHTSGPLGMLVRSGQVKKVDVEDSPSILDKASASSASPRASGSYFKTQSGLVFNEQELIYIDPKECEPWQYANRHDDEMGDMEELI